MVERKKTNAKRKLPLRKRPSKAKSRVDVVDRNSPIPGKINAASEKVFLDALYEGLTVGKACALAGVSRSGIYKHRDNHPGFSEAWDDAQRLGHAERCDVVRDTMWSRAVEGYQENEVRKWRTPDGKERTALKSVTRVDNTLLMALAKSLMPAEFRDNIKIDKTLDVSDQLAELMERASQSPQNSISSLVRD